MSLSKTSIVSGSFAIAVCVAWSGSTEAHPNAAAQAASPEPQETGRFKAVYLTRLESPSGQANAELVFENEGEASPGPKVLRSGARTMSLQPHPTDRNKSKT